MTAKTFSVRSNAVRNARSALGKTAQQGIDFVIGGDKTSGYTWSRLIEAGTAGAPPVDAAPAETPTPVSPSPKAVKAKVRAKAKVKVAAARRKPAKKVSRGRKAGRKALTTVAGVSGKRKLMFRLIASPHGASLKVLTSKLGWQKHTVRGAVSTIASQFKVKIKSFRDERRGRVYQVG